MKKATLLFALAALIFATSCVSSFKTTADYDKKTDFTVYKTYSLLPWDNGQNASISAEAKNTLFSAIKHEMNSRGYTLVEKGGDLTVGLSILIEDKVELRSDGSVNYNVGYGYYGYGGYGIGYSSPTTYREYHYNDGTAIVDIFDEKSKTMVWQGYGYDRLSDSPRTEIKNIPTYMKYIFYKYPVRAKRK